MCMGSLKFQNFILWTPLLREDECLLGTLFIEGTSLSILFAFMSICVLFNVF